MRRGELIVEGALVLVVALASAGCGRSPAYPRTHARAYVVARGDAPPPCRCDEEDDDDDDAEDADERTSRAKPVEYVKLDAWQPPPQVQELESKLPPRGDVPATYSQLPPLTLHQPIGETSLRRWWFPAHAR